MRHGVVLSVVMLGLLLACSDDSSGPPAASLIDPHAVPSFQNEWLTSDHSNDIAVTAGGNVMVSDYDSTEIAVYTSTGAALDSWTPTLESGSVTYPVNMEATLSPAQATYLVAWAPEPSRILVFDSTRELTTDAPEKYDSNEDGFAVGVDQLAVSPSGDIYRVRYYAESVIKYDPAGVYQTEWSVRGNPPGALNMAGGIAVTDDVVYVSDSYNDRIVMFSPSGHPLGEFGTSGEGPEQFRFPNGLAIADGVLYVVDRDNQRIQKLTLGGKYLAQFPPRAQGVLANPQLLAVRGRDVYVLQTRFSVNKHFVVHLRYDD